MNSVNWPLGYMGYSEVRRPRGEIVRWWENSRRNARSKRVWVCALCGRAVCRRYSLILHVRVHTGERPLLCPHCPRRFADPSNLNKHVRLHRPRTQDASALTLSTLRGDTVGKSTTIARPRLQDASSLTISTLRGDTIGKSSSSIAYRPTSQDTALPTLLTLRGDTLGKTSSIATRPQSQDASLLTSSTLRDDTVPKSTSLIATSSRSFKPVVNTQTMNVTTSTNRLRGGRMEIARSMELSGFEDKRTIDLRQTRQDARRSSMERRLTDWPQAKDLTRKK